LRWSRLDWNWRWRMFMRREQFRAAAIAMSVTAILAGSFLLFVSPSQRELILFADEDTQFYDGADGSKIIYVLSRGKSANIVRCEDTKTSIEPMIKLDDGRSAQRLTGRTSIQVRRTGMSWPRYLGCGDD
jgi:hypothetical protein